MKTTDTLSYRRAMAIAKVIPYRKNKRAIKAKWFEAIRDMLNMEKMMDDKTLCPLCGEGHVTPRTENTVTEYRGQQGNVTLQYAECDACGSEVVGDADGRANKRAVLRFHKSVDGELHHD